MDLVNFMADCIDKSSPTKLFHLANGKEISVNEVYEVLKNVDDEVKDVLIVLFKFCVISISQALQFHNLYSKVKCFNYTPLCHPSTFSNFSDFETDEKNIIRYVDFVRGGGLPNIKKALKAARQILLEVS